MSLSRTPGGRVPLWPASPRAEAVAAAWAPKGVVRLDTASGPIIGVGAPALALVVRTLRRGDLSRRGQDGSARTIDAPHATCGGNVHWIVNLRSDSLRTYDVDPAGGRLLIIRPVEETQPPSIRLTLHWFDEVRRLTSSR